MQFIVSSYLGLEKRIYCPSFFNGKLCKFRQVDYVFPVNDHSQIDIDAGLKARIDPFHNLFKGTSSSFQETAAVVDRSGAIKGHLYFPYPSFGKDWNILFKIESVGYETKPETGFIGFVNDITDLMLLPAAAKQWF